MIRYELQTSHAFPRNMSSNSTQDDFTKKRLEIEAQVKKQADLVCDLKAAGDATKPETLSEAVAKLRDLKDEQKKLVRACSEAAPFFFGFDFVGCCTFVTLLVRCIVIFCKSVLAKYLLGLDAVETNF